LPPSRTLYSKPASPSAEVSNSSAQDHGDPFFIELTHPPTPAICKMCHASFSSRNTLFIHLNEKSHFTEKNHSEENIIIVESKASSKNIDSGLAFWDFNYCEIQY